MSLQVGGVKNISTHSVHRSKFPFVCLRLSGRKDFIGRWGQLPLCIKVANLIFLSGPEFGWHKFWVSRLKASDWSPVGSVPCLLVAGFEFGSQSFIVCVRSEREGGGKLIFLGTVCLFGLSAFCC